MEPDKVIEFDQEIVNDRICTSIAQRVAALEARMKAIEEANEAAIEFAGRIQDAGERLDAAFEKLKAKLR